MEFYIACEKYILKELGFETSDKFDYCEYSGANNEIINVQNRSVTFCKEDKFWIVTDYIKPVDSEKETKYTQYWHMLPEAQMSFGENNVVKSNFEDGINVMIVPIGEIENSGIATNMLIVEDENGNVVLKYVFDN